MHHAYLLIGDKEKAREHVESLFGDLAGSPDFFPYSMETFGIAEARKLADQALRKAFTERKVFLVTPETITPEAQNALLKTFEEPIGGTHFFLVVRDAGVIIPTLLSRMQAVSLSAAVYSNEAASFLKSSVKERLAFVKKFVDQEKSLATFLDSLLLELKKAGKSAALASVFPMRLAAGERGASPRLVLEHLATVL